MMKGKVWGTRLMGGRYRVGSGRGAGQKKGDDTQVA